MKIMPTALVAITLILGSINLHAEQATAKVLSVTGNATANIPGRGNVQIKANDFVPVGTEISTAGGGTVLIGLTPGAGSLIEEDSSVSINRLNFEKKDEKIVKRDIELGLNNNKGAVISFLKELDGVSDFSVRTPKGVAAARGTTWRTTSSAVQVVNGLVTMTIGNITVSVPAGNAGNLEGGGVTGLTAEQISQLTGKLNEAREVAGLPPVTPPGANPPGTPPSTDPPSLPLFEEVNSQDQ